MSQNVKRKFTKEFKREAVKPALTHEHMPDGEYAFNPGITRR